MKDPSNQLYTRNSEVISKDDHQNYIAPEKDWIWFLCKASSKAHTYTANSQNKYIFFRGQKRLVKDKRDIEEFKKNIALFRELKDDEEVEVTETIPTPTLNEPIPTPKIEVKVVKRGMRKHKKGEEII